MPQTDHFGDVLAAADVAVSRAGGTVWELAAAGTPSILVPYPHATADHQTLNARHFERGGGAIVVPDAEIARCRRSSQSCSPTESGSRRCGGDALDGAGRCGRHDRRGVDRSCRRPASADAPLAGRRLYFVGIGGSGISAYANIARALGAEVRGWDLRDTIFMETLTGIEVDIGGEPTPPDGWEVGRLDRSHAPHRGNAAGGVPRGARRGAAVDRRRRRARQDDDRRDDRVRPARDRSRSGLDHRRHRAAARRQRGGGRGLARRRGRRVRPLDRRAAPQIAVVTNIELDHHASYASEAELRAFFDAWLGPSRRRPQLGARARRARARGAGRSQSPERRSGARGARARGRPTRGGRGGDRAVHRRGAAVRARRRARAASRSYDDYGSQPDRARGDAARRRASATQAAA